MRMEAYPCTRQIRWLLLGVWSSLTLFPCLGGQAESFSITTYNLENYILQARGTRPVKPSDSRRQIQASLKAIQADVVALQEIGGIEALQELRTALIRQGLTYPYYELITGFDTNIQVAVMSRFPIVARRPHTNEFFLLMGRRLKVSRGFLEIDIEPSASYRFTLFTTHLKSRRPVAFADEAEMRLKEAELLRKRIDARLVSEPDANIVVLGDLNDLQNSRPVRLLRGRGRRALTDLRPREQDIESRRPAVSASRTVAWTHYYGMEDTHSRIDYIMTSPGMTKEWQPEGTYVLARPDWGIGSDHRPIVARFHGEDR